MDVAIVFIFDEGKCIREGGIGIARCEQHCHVITCDMMPAAVPATRPSTIWRILSRTPLELPSMPPAPSETTDVSLVEREPSVTVEGPGGESENENIGKVMRENCKK